MFPHPGEAFAGGAEYDVYEDTVHPERVVKIRREENRESIRRAKARYYLGSLANLLLPEHFPRMYSGGAYDDERSFVSVAKAYVHPIHQKESGLSYGKRTPGKPRWTEQDTRELNTYNQSLTADPGYRLLLDAVTETGLMSPKVLDIAASNFERTPDGEIMHLDNLYPWQGHGNMIGDEEEEGPIERCYDPQKLQTAIMERIQDPLDQVRALRCLLSLERLFTEERGA